MKFLFRCWVGFLVAAAISASAQNLSTYLWTNVVAFPGLPAFANPICITSPPGETNRLFVCEHGGNIIVITNLAAPTRTVFLNLTTKVQFSGEAGLLGLAFHPGFATNGYFYVFYNTNSSLSDVVSRFKISTANEGLGDVSSETPLFVQTDRANNHNGGDLHFGPDAYLYVSVGDEGNEYNTFHNAQHINSNLFSGILRIDVDKLPGSLSPNPNSTALITTNYAVPSDNPFVGATTFDGISVNPASVRTEFWAVGLRNPWRFSFDPVTGLLYCGDVGQDQVEEVDIIKKGGNYGWATYEGTTNPPSGVNTNGQPIAQNVIAPIIQYTHGSGLSQGDCVIGGVVYRGTRFPELGGAYIYGDYSNKRFWATFYDGTNATTPFLLFNAASPTAFGVDPQNGDVLYCEDGASTTLKRIISATPFITSVAYSSTNVIVSGSGGTPGRFVDLLSTTNLSIPLTNWAVTAISHIDPLANFSLTNAGASVSPQMFFFVIQ